MIKSRPNKAGKLRHQVLVYDPTRKSGKRPCGTYATMREARRVEQREISKDRGTESVASFAARWPIDFCSTRSGPTLKHNSERIKAFVDRYGKLPLDRVDWRMVDQYLSGGKRNGTVPALRAMFNDAKKRRLVNYNPFAELGIANGKGNKEKHPPSTEKLKEALDYARKHTPLSFVSWLEAAFYLGARCGELDGLEWSKVDLRNNRVLIDQQFVAGFGMKLPKGEKPRTILLPPRAKEVLLRLPRESKYVFTTSRGNHYTASARTPLWNTVRAGVGLEGKSLYLCTRHYAASYMINVLDMESAVVAHQLGHDDGGTLVERLYGHRDKNRSFEKLLEAHLKHDSEKRDCA